MPPTAAACGASTGGSIAEMRSIGVCWTVAIAIGCSDVCETAADKMDDCKIEEEVKKQGYARFPVVVSRDDCSGFNECAAECTEDATCASLQNVIVRGFYTDPSNPPPPGAAKIYGCLRTCIEKYVTDEP